MKILLTSYGGGHIAMLLPLWRELTDRGHTCELFALTTAKVAAAQAGITCSRPIDYVDMTNQAILNWGERLAERHHTDGKGLSREESIAYLGVSFRDLAATLGEKLAWERYQQLGLNAFSPVAFMRSVITRSGAQCVVATNSPRMEKAAMRAAFQLDIPSLCLVDLFGLYEEPWLSRPDNGHILAVTREDVKRRLVASGREEMDIHLTGNPMFDQLADPGLAGAGAAWRRQHNLSDNDRVIFWAEQPEPGNEDLPRNIRVYLAEICHRNGWRLVVRLHPNTDASRETIPPTALQSRSDEPLTHLIHACDVGVTMTSTVGWELLLSGKPLLVLPFSRYSDTVLYGDGDGALVAPSLTEVEDALRVLLGNSPKARNLANQRQQLPTPGGATQRVCDLIERTVLTRRYSLEIARATRATHDG